MLLADASNCLALGLDNRFEAFAHCLGVRRVSREIDPKLLDFPSGNTIGSPFAFKTARRCEGAKEGCDSRNRRRDIRDVLPLL